MVVVQGERITGIGDEGDSEDMHHCSSSREWSPCGCVLAPRINGGASMIVTRLLDLDSLLDFVAVYSSL